MDVFIGLACVMQVAQLGAIMYYHGRIMPELRIKRDALKKGKGRPHNGEGMTPGYTFSQKELKAKDKRRRQEKREDAKLEKQDNKERRRRRDNKARADTNGDTRRREHRRGHSDNHEVYDVPRWVSDVAEVSRARPAKEAGSHRHGQCLCVHQGCDVTRDLGPIHQNVHGART